MSLADRLAAWLPLLWFAIVAAILFWLWASGLAGSLLRRVSKFGGFGLEFEFSESSAKQTRDAIESQLAAVRKTIQRELGADVRARGLQDALKTILEDPTVGLAPGPGYRATVHIPDPLYENQLYQLLDYYPQGTGSGRTFSTRSGIIGLTWRTGTPQQWDHSSAITQLQLIQQWGMTPREAASRNVVDSTKVMIAVPLRDLSESRQVGVLYLDAKADGKFGTDETARNALIAKVSAVYQTKMAGSLTELVESAQRRSPQLVLESG